MTGGRGAVGGPATVLVFSAIVLLAASALYFGPDYPAHVPLTIGVSAFDSAAAGPQLESMAALVRESGGGDIEWVWVSPERIPCGCDLYLMTSVGLRPFLESGRLDLIMVASARPDGAPGRGVLISVSGREDPADGDSVTVAYTSPRSSTGFVSPRAALGSTGIHGARTGVFVSPEGFPICPIPVVYGVLDGRWDLGGVPLEGLRLLERRGLVEEGSLSVLAVGPEMHEIVLASDPGMESWKRQGFSSRLPGMASGFPGPLKRELERLGMLSFRESSPEDVESILGISSEGP